jgi:uncharacterized membrane protein
MSFKYRVTLICGVVSMLLAVASTEAYAKRQVPPVRNLTVVNADANQVKLDWDPPSTAGLGGATIDQYIIRRDGHQLTTLVGFNGQVDSAYVDGSPSQNDAVYEVIAVDSHGRRSPPEEVEAKGSQTSAVNVPKTAQDDQRDVIQGSSLCDSIIPPDIRGHNQPTPLEVYGCGKGMDTVYEDGPDHFLGVAKPRPIHDIIQSFYVQLPVTLGHIFFLLIHALSIWVLQAGTYMGIGNLFAGILQALNGNPNWPALVSIGISCGILVISWRILKDDHREGYKSVALVVMGLTLVTMLVGSPFTWLRKTVNKPLGLYADISSLSVDLTTNTDVSRQFNLQVHPTFTGDKNNNAIRKQENADFLMYQYLPACAINFGDYRWAMQHTVPGTNITYCEKFAQVFGDGTKEEQDKLRSDIEDDNKKVSDFYRGGDQMQRVGFAIVSKWFTLLIHNLVKALAKLSIFFCEMLLIAEVFSAAIWLLHSMVGNEAAQEATERRILTMLHYIKVPAVMTILGVLETTIVANVITRTFNFGFLAMSAILSLVELAFAIFLIRQLLKMRRDHKMKMEARNAYRQDTSGIKRRGMEYALAGAGAAWGAYKYRDHREHKKKEKGSRQTREEIPVQDPSGFYTSPADRPALETHSNGDARHSPNDNPPKPAYDADADAEEYDPPELERTTGGGASDDPSDGESPNGGSSGPRRPDHGPGPSSGGPGGPRSPNGFSGGNGTNRRPDTRNGHDDDIDDADVVDAEVVEDRWYGGQRRA